jgi:hypothetical protein
MIRRSFLFVALAAVLGGTVTGSAAAEPNTPAITASDPASPADNDAPILVGTAEPLATVDIYTNSECAGTPAASGLADPLSNFAIPVSVPNDSQTTFYATATDLTGISACSSGFTYVEDSTPPPPPTITAHPAEISNDPNPSFSFTDDEGGVTFNCRLTSGAFPPCTSPKDYSLADGSYIFYVKAVDAAKNESSTAPPFQWTIDTEAPQPPTILNGPPTPSSSTAASFTFDAEVGALLRCQLDGGSFSACPNPATFTVADGSHTLVVQAVDQAGNVSGPSTPYLWVVDTVHPLVTITDKPLLVTNRTSADFSFSSTPSPDHYECALDGAAFGTCSSPKHYGGLGDGLHTFAVRTVSAGGSRGASTTYVWRVDTVAPQTAIGSGPPAVSNSAAATFAFTSNESGSTFVCSINSAGFTPCSSPHGYSGLGDGTYTFRVQAVDAAGNADTTPAVYTWRISGVGAPIADLKPPANVGKLKRNVGYGRMQLRWRRPADSDFDHVNVYVSTSRKTPPRRLVYTGKHQSYTDRHFKNGQYYRFLVVSYDRAKNASGGRSVLVPPSALLTLPRNGSTVRGVPKFRWTAVRRASFYNMQVYLKGQKILSTWPGKARQSLTRNWWYGGRRYALRRGLYVWYVWPGFGPRTKGRYGQLLGQGSFKVR